MQCQQLFRNLLRVTILEVERGLRGRGSTDGITLCRRGYGLPEWRVVARGRQSAVAAAVR
jgi:hypothetical protein